MDFIARKNYVPFVNDKTLWIKSLNKTPGYEYLLGWDKLMDERSGVDTDEQEKTRHKFSSREKFIQHQLDLHNAHVGAAVAVPGAFGPALPAAGGGGFAGVVVAPVGLGAVNRASAIAQWDAIWTGTRDDPAAQNPYKPTDYYLGAADWNPYNDVNDVDFYGNAKYAVGHANAGQYMPRIVPPYHYQRRWLLANQDYRAVGWRGSPANPIIRRFYAPPAAPAAPAAPGAAPVAPGAAPAPAPAPAPIVAPGGGIVPALPAARLGIFG